MNQLTIKEINDYLDNLVLADEQTVSDVGSMTLNHMKTSYFYKNLLSIVLHSKSNMELISTLHMMMSNALFVGYCAALSIKKPLPSVELPKSGNEKVVVN